MKVRFILGPAGSGKTHACLAELRSQLMESPQGSSLVLLAPKQATFQLERQLFAGGELSGYERLQILSFERLAAFVLKTLDRPAPALLSDEGRLMVLRSLLALKHDKLRLFHASARLPGFAQELLKIIDEFQRCRLTPAHLRQFAAKPGVNSRLGMKLNDVALLMEAYRDWLKTRELGDADAILDAAAESLATLPCPNRANAPDQPDRPFFIELLWMDGFAELTPQELNFLTALVPFCGGASLAFCLDEFSDDDPSWMSTWSLTSRSFRLCHAKMASIPENRIETRILERNPILGRFAASPMLGYLEKNWSLDVCNASRDGVVNPSAEGKLSDAVRLVSCTKPDLEVIFAAHEIMRHVRQGGRYRECAVLLRQFDIHHHSINRIFNRYHIPFFMDRREAISHHPLAELTRCLVRTAALGWTNEDWFGALKTGLIPVDDESIDALENAALAAGWAREFWCDPILEPDSKIDTEWMRLFHRKVVLPFLEFEAELLAADSTASQALSGQQLAIALRNLWRKLAIEDRLKQWSDAGNQPGGAQEDGLSGALHATVWQQMHIWLKNLALAFPEAGMSLPEWLPILESGLAGMTVGVIPPSLDQVLISTLR